MAYICRTARSTAVRRFFRSRISRKLTFSALVSALAIAAFATESQAANWTGCHGAVAAGFTTLTAEPEAGADGTQIGVAAGCDYQSDDRIVFGAFLGYDWKTFDVGSAGEIDATSLTFGGRAGFLLGRDRDTLAYGLLAYTNIEVEDLDEDSDGLAYGGGLESVVYRNRGGFLTLKGEARRIDYDTEAAGDDGTETTVTAGLAYHFGGVPTADDLLPPLK
jgi:Outer membrane protein beta-barrel domain